MVKRTTLFLAEILSFWFFVSLIHALFKFLANLYKLDLNNFGVILINWAIYGFIILLVAIIISKTRRKWTLKDLGFRTHNGWWKDICYGVVAYAILVIIDLPFDIILLPQRAEQAASLATGISQIVLPLQILVILGIGLVAGFITGAWHEEIHYRGYLQGAAAQELTPLAAVIGSWFIFSFGHYFSHPEWTLAQSLSTLTAGLVFCLVYIATKSLIPAMVAHTLSNTIAALPIFYYNIASKRVAYLIEAGIACAMIIILLFGRKTLKHLWQNTVLLFKEKAFLGILLGIILAAVGLLEIPARSYLKKAVGNTTYLIAIGILAVCFFAISMIFKNKKE